jgi:uncharacterized protein GlcG (DUF336 family)
MKRNLITLLTTIGLLAACSGGSGGGSTNDAEQAAVDSPAPMGTPVNCGENCFLSAVDVETIIAQAVAEAEARDIGATIAVVDRVGNVLGVFQSSNADAFVTVTSTSKLGAPVTGGLESLNFIPAGAAAISKAITGTYLSTGENAFTTRTASQIVQENFNPGEANVPSGPLFGVQFSQLPCSDFSQRFQNGPTSTVGPHRAPLGLAADPGGLPLYINGVNVGGVGVIADGIYGLDKVITDFDQNVDELIATAASVGYAAPLDIRADRITIVGKTARFSDVFVTDLQSIPGQSDPIATIVTNGRGNYVPVTAYFDGTGARAGTVFGQPGSGIRAADASAFVDANGVTLDAFVFVDQANQNRYPARNGLDAPAGNVINALTAAEVQTLMNEAIGVANQSRAQIRVPAGTQARVTISVVDTNGNILGMGRTRDGPIFGADVSLQKARTATFFSGTGRLPGQTPGDILRGFPDPLYASPMTLPIALSKLDTLPTPAPSFSGYVLDVQIFLGNAGALETTGELVAFSDRAGGNLSRPNFPDGPISGRAGPLSKPRGEWSIFSVGLQLDLSYNSVIHHVAHILGAPFPDVPQNCTGNTGFSAVDPFTVQNAVPNLANGIQIFPGSVPIYRGELLVGGIGVSGDGVDQDDMFSFLGLHRAGERLGTINNAPPEIRADRLTIPGEESRLRYVNCPQLPFIGSNDTEVCDGL